MSDINILDKFIDISQDSRKAPLLDRLGALRDEKEKKEFSPQEMAVSLLSLLKPREGQILRLRYGLDGNGLQTLKQIGDKLDLTRERVRQLEKQALKNITKHNRYDEITVGLRHLVQEILESHGGLMSIELIIQELISLTKNQDNTRAAIEFLLAHCLTGIEKVEGPPKGEAGNNFHPSLKLINVSMDFINQVLTELEKIFIQANKILELPEIIKKFEALEYYQSNKEKFFTENVDVNNIIFSYLDASKKFIQTPLNQWGLSDWLSVTPKRINGKIYLVLMSIKKPLHFSKITQLINEKWPGKRDVKAATVHNELIADKRFILVGRGIYALKDWGYDSRSVKEIIKDILDKNKDASQEEIIQQVKEKKMVKESTIRMAIRRCKN